MNRHGGFVEREIWRDRSGQSVYTQGAAVFLTQWSFHAKVFSSPRNFVRNSSFGRFHFIPIGNSGAAPSERLELNRGGATIVLEPYAPNILRVTLSLQHEPAVAAPGYGIVGAPAGEGWTASETAGADVYHSARIVAKVDKDLPSTHPPLQTQVDHQQVFQRFRARRAYYAVDYGGQEAVGDDGVVAVGSHHKDGTAQLALDRRPRIRPPMWWVQLLSRPDDEHYYGLGQNHEGFLDHRGHPVRCWQDYTAPAAPSTCVPFLVTNKGYGLLWDNPSKTTISAGFNEQTRWTSEVGDRVSFFVIEGATADEIYAGYRLLTGPTHMLPKAAYGYIQCKQRYASQKEVLDVAQGYRDRHLPADVMVVGLVLLHKNGQMDMDPKFWPDPVAMNKQLHAMGFETMISVWPALCARGQFLQRAAREGLAHSPGQRHADQRVALRPGRIGYRHDESRGGEVVLEDNSRQHFEFGIRFAVGG